MQPICNEKSLDAWAYQTTSRHHKIMGCILYVHSGNPGGCNPVSICVFSAVSCSLRRVLRIACTRSMVFACVLGVWSYGVGVSQTRKPKSKTPTTSQNRKPETPNSSTHLNPLQLKPKIHARKQTEIKKERSGGKQDAKCIMLGRNQKALTEVEVVRSGSTAIRYAQLRKACPF